MSERKGYYKRNPKDGAIGKSFIFLEKGTSRERTSTGRPPAPFGVKKRAIEHSLFGCFRSSICVHSFQHSPFWHFSHKPLLSKAERLGAAGSSRHGGAARPLFWCRGTCASAPLLRRCTSRRPTSSWRRGRAPCARLSTTQPPSPAPWYPGTPSWPPRCLRSPIPTDSSS